MSELNHLRQRAVDELMQRRDWARQAALSERRERVETEVAGLAVVRTTGGADETFRLVAEVFDLGDADAAAQAGATEIVFDPFLRHPAPPKARLRALQERLAGRGIPLRLRTPTIVRPEERAIVQKWLDLGLPVQSGHLGLVAELSRAGRT